MILISTSGQSTLSVRGGNFELPLGIPVYMLRRAIMSPTHSKESSNQSHTQVGSDEIDQDLSTVNEDSEMEGFHCQASLVYQLM
jgi:DNA helicase TIP49 (TBP-interacting protein)